MNEKRWWCCNAEYGEHEPTCQNAALSPVVSEPLFGTCETCETKPNARNQGLAPREETNAK